MQTALKLSKLEVARRQLMTAVRLYFSERDPVSIHTLTVAAHEILRNLSGKLARSPMIMDAIIDVIKPERKDEFRKAIRAPSNFFKHADRDPDATLDFSPQFSAYWLLDACLRYEELAHERIDELVLFRLWLQLTEPDLFILTSDLRGKIDENAGVLRTFRREQFFLAMLPHMSKGYPLPSWEELCQGHL